MGRLVCSGYGRFRDVLRHQFVATGPASVAGGFCEDSRRKNRRRLWGRIGGDSGLRDAASGRCRATTAMRWYRVSGARTTCTSVRNLSPARQEGRSAGAWAMASSPAGNTSVPRGKIPRFPGPAAVPRHPTAAPRRGELPASSVLHVCAEGLNVFPPCSKNEREGASGAKNKLQGSNF
jgi:hypothetical protein